MGVTVRSLTDEEKQTVKQILVDLQGHVQGCEQCREANEQPAMMCPAGAELYRRWLAWLP